MSSFAHLGVHGHEGLSEPIWKTSLHILAKAFKFLDMAWHHVERFFAVYSYIEKKRTEYSTIVDGLNNWFELDLRSIKKLSTSLHNAHLEKHLRRDSLRFLKAMNEDFFADGVRHTLSDDGISMAFWLCTGYAPHMRLRDMRATSRGDLTFSSITYGISFTIWVVM